MSVKDEKRFVKYWNSKKKASEVAAHFGLTEGSARVKASLLRYKGYDLKRMYRGGRRRKQCVIQELNE